LHRLKYQNDIGLGQALADPLTQYLQQLSWHVDLVVPVPLGKDRKNDRGYNQVALLALPLALNCDLDYLPDALIRDRETMSQVGLSVHERMANVSGAFAAVPSKVTGKRVLIVDDVCTTGATIRSCAVALKQAGATAVYGLSLARAVLAHDI
jgi:ComF family protein